MAAHAGHTIESDSLVEVAGVDLGGWDNPTVTNLSLFSFSVEGLECIAISDRDGVMLVEGKMCP